VEKVSDHRTIGPRKFFEFPETISPRKKKCNNLDKRRKCIDLNSAIVYKCMANAFLKHMIFKIFWVSMDLPDSVP
jgi:tRNA U38,U39,U40 pseudouridine synthase TruA